MGIGLLVRRLLLIAEKGVEGQSNAVLLKCRRRQGLPTLSGEYTIRKPAKKRFRASTILPVRHATKLTEEKCCSVAAIVRKKHFSASW
jgi:hypothetical protein